MAQKDRSPLAKGRETFSGAEPAARAGEWPLPGQHESVKDTEERSPLCCPLPAGPLACPLLAQELRGLPRPQQHKADHGRVGLMPSGKAAWAVTRTHALPTRGSFHTAACASA